jgi:TonB family protein
MKRLVDRYYEFLSHAKGGNIRSFSLAAGITVTLVVTLTLFWIQFQSHSADAAATPAIEDLGGMSGGGGGEDSKEITIEFGPASGEDGKEDEAPQKSKTLRLINIEIISPRPVPDPPEEKKEEVKPKKKVAKKGPAIAYVPKRRIRGVGPGSGGGYGTGQGGGIGAGTGYSIDWGGTGSRRLLSARSPVYPSSETDKEMVVILQFVVLPDGTVSDIRPLNRSDQALERAGIAALTHWRFESLPPQLGEKLQRGKISFNFKLER